MKFFQIGLPSATIGTWAVSFCAAVIALLGPAVSSAAPTARVVASRTSGPAPLAVFFDATGTTDSNSSVDTFRQLGYRFSFGDPNSGTWPYSGRSKNEQIGGPLAAHVFERPGTYTVQVTAADASGATSTATVSITVQSADEAFAGTRTVCLSRNSDFSGCPSGAQQIANASSWPSFQSNHRYLLHAGQDFTSLGRVSFGAGSSGLTNSQLGSFGSGAQPVVGDVTIRSGSVPVTTWNQRIVVMNLNVSGIRQETGGIDLLVLGNTVNRGGMIDIAYAFDYSLTHSSESGWRNPENIFVVGNQVDRQFNAASGNPNGITGNGTRLVIMGNLVDNTDQHNVRVWQGHKTFIAHNRLTGRAGEKIRHTLKIHASGTNEVATSLPAGVNHGQRSSYFVIADNEFGSGRSNVQFLTSSGPQSTRYSEGLEYFIWEDNKFLYGTEHVVDINWAGRQMTERGGRNVTKNSLPIMGNMGEFDGWRGPYYAHGASMKQRFSGEAATVRVPRNPTNVAVD